MAKKKSSLDEDPVAPASGMEKWSKYNFSNQNNEMGNSTTNSHLSSSSYGKLNTTEKPKLLGEKRQLASGNNIIGTSSKWSKYNSNPSDDLALPTTLSKQPAYNSGDDGGHTEKVLSASFGHVEKVNSPPLPTMATAASIVDEKVMAPSEDAYEQSQLSPCESCGRTFNAKALER